ncbi:VOC family protein [Robertmurraya massiliosenegalensis]|uniref:VOC family protein n=1 Tax=Robertmurraya TaxID=2837507 RepID=UPI0039A6C6C3
MKFHESPNVYADEVCLKVTDKKRAVSFYQNMLGLQILKETSATTVFTADGKTPLLTIVEPENVTAKEPRRTGLYHFALLLPTRAELAACLKHLVESRYPLQGASDHVVSEAIYLADPDGNGIEIYADRPSETWQWSGELVRMDTVALDVEDLFKEWDGKAWAGLPQGTIMGHIHLHVADLRAAEEFYCDTLGFDVVARYGDQALFVSSGKYHHHIGLNTWNGRGAPSPSEDSAGLQFFTLKYPHQKEKLQVVERLKNRGYPVEIDGDNIKVTDPSGTRIILRA